MKAIALWSIFTLLFVTSYGCDCDSCGDNEVSAPRGLRVMIAETTCFPGDRAFFSSLKIQSTDGSRFTLCTKSSTTSECDVDASAENVDCYNKDLTTVVSATNKLKVEITCLNVWYSCPLVSDIVFACTKESPSPSPTPTPDEGPFPCVHCEGGCAFDCSSSRVNGIDYCFSSGGSVSVYNGVCVTSVPNNDCCAVSGSATSTPRARASTSPSATPTPDPETASPTPSPDSGGIVSDGVGRFTTTDCDLVSLLGECSDECTRGGYHIVIDEAGEFTATPTVENMGDCACYTITGQFSTTTPDANGQYEINTNDGTHIALRGEDTQVVLTYVDARCSVTFDVVSGRIVGALPGGSNGGGPDWIRSRIFIGAAIAVIVAMIGAAGGLFWFRRRDTVPVSHELRSKLAS